MSDNDNKESPYQVHIELRKRELRHGDVAILEAGAGDFREIMLTLQTAGKNPVKVGETVLNFNPRYNTGDTVPQDCTILYNALRHHVATLPIEEREAALTAGLETIAASMDQVASHLMTRNAPGSGSIDSDEGRAHQVREIAGSLRDLAQGKNPKTGQEMPLDEQMKGYGRMPASAGANR